MVHFHLPNGHYKKEFLIKWNALAADLAGTASVGSFNVTSGMIDREGNENYLMRRFGLSKEDLMEGPVIRYDPSRSIHSCSPTHPPSITPPLLISFTTYFLTSLSLSHVISPAILQGPIPTHSHSLALLFQFFSSFGS